MTGGAIMLERSRNKNGRFRKKRGDTERKTLKKTYDGLIPSGSPIKKLKSILTQTGSPSLTKLVRRKNEGT